MWLDFIYKPYLVHVVSDNNTWSIFSKYGLTMMGLTSSNRDKKLYEVKIVDDNK